MDEEPAYPVLDGTWQRYVADDGHRCIRRMTCTLHPEVGWFCSCKPGLYRAPDGAVVDDVYTVCVACWYAAHRAPKQSELGLEELPEYWRQTTAYRFLGEVALVCDYHPHNAFRIDECCRRCVDEDLESGDRVALCDQGGSGE